ncbi:hypothetical protein BS78_05G234400 [Paspalum vaginatum]|nr:hypothetical protein BS78_05G234400 [Paspalum vaginatum]
MATLSFKSPSSSEVENRIWDLETEKVVHTLAANGHQTSCIAGHPPLPILVTALDDGTICFWDTSTYRLEESVHFTDRAAHDLALFTDTEAHCIYEFHPFFRGARIPACAVLFGPVAGFPPYWAN